MDLLFLSKRIFLDGEFVNGGILVSQSGKIREIFTTQEQVNTWLYSNQAEDVSDIIYFLIFIDKNIFF